MENESKLLDDDDKTNLYKHVIYTLSDRGRKALVSQAANEIENISIEEFDRQKFFLNLQNGTYDLEHQKFLPHDPKHYLMNMANVTYVKGMRSLLWEKTILEIMDGNLERVKYLQKVFGYALCEDDREQCFFLFHGEGSNGKSLVVSTIYNMLGDYAKAAQTATLMIKPESTNGHTADVR